MNLRWMMLFATIAEEGSFTRAATKLNIAQPWLSAQIRKLEYEIGVQLLVRQSSGVQTTAEGEALLPYARQLAEAARQFRETARRLGQEQTKTVMIGSHMPMLDIPGLRDINLKFLSTYSNSRIDGTLTEMPDLLERLRHGELDLVVAMTPLPDSGAELEAIELRKVVPTILCHTDAKIETLADLRGKQVAIPPMKWHPDFIGKLIEYMKSLEAQIVTVPEFDRRAMEHLARVRKQPVVMISEGSEDYAASAEFITLPLPAMTEAHQLLRLGAKEAGRAAERYWRITADQVSKSA